MDHERGRSFGQIGVGIFLLIVGAVLFLDKTDLFRIEIFNNVAIWRLWPLIFIAIGIGRLLDAKSIREYQKGLWMFFLGVWFLVSEFHIFGLSFYNSWPILLIGVGIGILWRSFSEPHRLVKDNCNGH